MRGTALFVAAILAAAFPAAAAETLSVRMNQSAPVRLSAPARDVVIGNPEIADVNVLDGRNLVVLGKSYGVTNLLVMDQAGRMILNRQIVVSGPEPGISFYRGGELRSYACGDRCELIGGADTQAAAPQDPAPTP